MFLFLLVLPFEVLLFGTAIFYILSFFKLILIIYFSQLIYDSNFNSYLLGVKYTLGKGVCQIQCLMLQDGGKKNTLSVMVF